MKQGIETRVPTSSTTDPSVQELVEKNALLEQENLRLKSKYEALLEQIRLFQQRFGASSEKCPADQQDLFNEADALVDEDEAVTQDSSDVAEAAATRSASEEKRPASAAG